MSNFPGISSSAAQDVHGVASSVDDNGNTNDGQGGSDGDVSTSEILVTKTGAAGEVVLSTRTVAVGVQTTKVVVVTATSTDLIISTDQAGLTGESILGLPMCYSS